MSRRSDRYIQERKYTFRRMMALGIVCMLVFLAFTVAVCVYDRQPLSPQGREVGFGSLNHAFRQFTGLKEDNAFSSSLYKASKYMGYLSILVAGCFFLAGFTELIRQKSLRKVSPDLLILGVLYAVVFVMYVLFDRLPINYRPVIVDPAEGLELSYPSTHTLLALCVLLPAAGLLRTRVSSHQLGVIGYWGCIILAVLIVLTRMLCGVHWLTDICGAVLLSVSLLCFYGAARARFAK